jgi:hypothetical protein
MLACLSRTENKDPKTVIYTNETGSVCLRICGSCWEYSVKIYIVWIKKYYFPTFSNYFVVVMLEKNDIIHVNRAEGIV